MWRRQAAAVAAAARLGGGGSVSVSVSVTGLRAPVTRAYRSMPNDGVHGLAAQRSRASLCAGSSERVGRGGCTTVRGGAYSKGHKAGRWRAPRAALPAGTAHGTCRCAGSRSSRRGRGTGEPAAPRRRSRSRRCQPRHKSWEASRRASAARREGEQQSSGWARAGQQAWSDG